MNRSSNSILAGTLLISLLLSPAARSGSPEPMPQQQQETARETPRSLKITAAGSELSAEDRERIKKDASDVYRRELEDVIEDECERGATKQYPKTQAPAKNKRTAKDQDFCHIGRTLTLSNFLIALLPDPVHTHLALEFDRGIDAIEEGLQDEGYLFVDSKMPWDQKTHPESEDHVEREATEVAQEAREEEPGVMVFRARDGDPLVILVVSEAPTTGINKDQFRHAMGEMVKLIQETPRGQESRLDNPEAWHGSATSPGLRILGPAFSGSLASLADMLECKKPSDSSQAEHCPLVSIHSGTISSYNAIQEFEKQATHRTYFVSFQESDDVVIERFQEFLTGSAYGQRGYEEGKIALLSEDESAYGKLVTSDEESQKVRATRPKALQRERDWEAYGNITEWWHPSQWWPHWFFQRLGRRIFHPIAEGIRAIGGDKDRAAYASSIEKSNSMLTLYFPREISQLRAAYQKDVASTSTDGRNVPRDILPTYSDVPGSDDDTVASYSARQMPMSQEAVLLGIVSELRRHKTQFILVRATDPMDTLFLVRYLRAVYPQGRIVTLGADMLFRREAEDPRFHGLLSLSTYSLSTAANHGYKDYEQHAAERIFPSNLEAGTYNATRSLLSAWVDADPRFCLLGQPCRHTLRRHVKDCQKGSSNDSLDCVPTLYQYGWRQQLLNREFTDYDAPPVRLLALGRDQYWPVAALGPYCEKHSTLLPQVPNQLIGSPEAVEIPKSWLLVQLAGLGIAFFFCWSLWRSSIFARLQPAARFAPAVRDRRLTLILVAGFTVFFILLILMWPGLHGARSAGWQLEGWLLLALIAVFFTVLLEGFNRALAKAPSCPVIAEKLQPEAWEHESPLPFGVGVSSSAGGGAHAVAAVRQREAERQKRTVRVRVAAAAAVPKRVLARTKELFAKISFSARWKPWFGVALFFLASVILLVGVGSGEPEAEASALVRWFSTLRTVQLTSGLSFIMPTFFFLTVWLWWAEQVSSGYTLLDDRRPRLPSDMKKQRVQFLRQDAFPDLCSVITPGPFRFLHYLVVSALVVWVGGVIMGKYHPMMSLEKPLLEWAMTILFLLAICGIVVSTLQAWSVWLALRKLLVQLDASRLRDAFKVLEGFSWKPIWRFGAGSLEEYQRIFSRNREAMDCAINTVPELSKFRPVLEGKLRQVTDLVPEAKQKSLLWHFFGRRKEETDLIREFGAYQELASEAAGGALDLLADAWDNTKEETKPSRIEAAVPWASGDDSNAVVSKLKDEENDSQLRACKRLVCMSYTSFIMVMLVRIRTLILAIGGMYVLTLVAISQYPFEPKGALQLLLVALLAFVIAIVGLIFAQIYRDTILSNLTDTKPGELGIDFFIRMASFVALPLLSLMASQFPSMNRFFYSWLQPAIEALNH
jgi:hypothetical protein